MSGVYNSPATVSGWLTADLVLIEERVQTQIGLAIEAGTIDETSVQQLRNDEAIGLGLPTPVPTA